MWAAVVGAPLLWLVLLQTNFVLAYPTCANRSNTWLHVTSAAALALMILLAFGARHVWKADRPQHGDGDARHFLNIVGVLVTALFVVVVIGTGLPPLILNPCD